MTTYAIIEKATGIEVYRYNADAAIDMALFPFGTFDHVPQPADPVPIPAPRDPARWRIYVGPFFDRFGAAKLAILADPDPVVQAIVKDTGVRQYIDLDGRRDDILAAINVLKAKGHAIDASAILDVEPTDAEVWHG